MELEAKLEETPGKTPSPQKALEKLQGAQAQMDDDSDEDEDDDSDEDEEQGQEPTRGARAEAQAAHAARLANLEARP